MNILLTSDATPLPSGKITMDEASWITSLMSVGASISIVVFGFMTNKFGRKIPLFLIGIPMIVSEITVVRVIRDNFQLIFVSGAMAARLVCSKYILFVRIKGDRGVCRRLWLYGGPNIFHRNWRRAVIDLNVFVCSL